MSLSSVTISGTLKKDPEKRFTPTNIPVANLTLEVCYQVRNPQEGQENLSSKVVRVNAWRDLAEDCERKLKAGNKILVIGRLLINAYTNSEGKKKREIEIDANSIVLLDDVLAIIPPTPKEEIQSKKDSSLKKPNQDLEQISNFEEVLTSTEEIPF